MTDTDRVAAVVRTECKKNNPNLHKSTTIQRYSTNGIPSVLSTEKHWRDLEREHGAIV